MKKLYLIRHSKSSWDDPTLDDFDRPLNNRGKKDRYVMANFLKEQGIYPDLVLCSPSVRTKKSLKAYQEILDIKDKNIIFDEDLYESSAKKLLDVLHTTDNTYDNVFLISHNPSLNELVDYLLNGFEENIPTSGIVGINVNIADWSMLDNTNCSLYLFTYPKQING